MQKDNITNVIDKLSERHLPVYHALCQMLELRFF